MHVWGGGCLDVRVSHAAEEAGQVWRTGAFGDRRRFHQSPLYVAAFSWDLVCVKLWLGHLRVFK